MTDQLLLLFQVLFLVFLYLFIWRVIRMASRDLRLPQESFILGPSHLPDIPAPVGPRHRVVVETSRSVPAGSFFGVASTPVTIGRSGENVITLPGDDYVSALHARIELRRDGLWLVDLGSRNGTYLNGEAVTGHEQLRPGDLVKIGDTELRIAS
jgi:hypothetical protein